MLTKRAIFYCYGNIFLLFQLQKSEDVHVEVVPGSYAVTAGRWGAEREHTHVVRIEPGQTVDLTFAI